MIKSVPLLFGMIFNCWVGNPIEQTAPSLAISDEFAQKVGREIWRNECNCTIEGLTTWNKGEEFASMGIGHFIWYPQGKAGNFKETFPDLIKFFEKEGVELPDWLKVSEGCPWQAYEEFQEAKQAEDERILQLRHLLAEYVDFQILFMMNRLQRSWSGLLQKMTTPRQKRHLSQQFDRLAATPQGLYVLLDYLNFKGEGLSPKEAYQGQGWGLMQVLEKMSGRDPKMAVEDFINAAKWVLTRRVEHSPPERREQKWLKGWYNRLDHYLDFK